MLTRRTKGLLSVTLVLGLSTAATASHSQPGTPGGVLKQRARPLLWQGRVGPEDAPKGGEPAECAAGSPRLTR